MHTNPGTCRTQLANLLSREVKLTERFADLLGDEYGSIARRDIATLECLIEDKTEILERLAALEQERMSALASAGFATGHDGMTACLQWCDPQRITLPLWETLQASAHVCSRLNRKNQQLVDLCSRHTRKVLHVLRGEDTGQQIYQADGETEHRHSNRSLAKV